MIGKALSGELSCPVTGLVKLDRSSFYGLNSIIYHMPYGRDSTHAGRYLLPLEQNLSCRSILHLRRELKVGGSSCVQYIIFLFIFFFFQNFPLAFVTRILSSFIAKFDVWSIRFVFLSRVF